MNPASTTNARAFPAFASTIYARSPSETFGNWHTTPIVDLATIRAMLTRFPLPLPGVVVSASA